MNETFDFAKTRIERYENYNTNDQVKSLVRLMDKTTELSRVIAQEDNLSEEMLDEYANEQRLTGILVLDQNQKVTEQTANCLLYTSKDNSDVAFCTERRGREYFPIPGGSRCHVQFCSDL